MNKKSLLDDILVLDKSEISTQEDEMLKPLLDEINLIEDESIRSFVRSVLLKSEMFWTIPSSFSGKYHPQDEHGAGGNALHTKRVTRIASTLCDSYALTPEERDTILAACLLHDITKGIPDSDKEMFHYDPMHPYTAGKFITNCQKFDKEFGNDSASSSLFITEEVMQTIMRLIRCHLGPWSPVPETYPITYLDYIVHISDNVASKLHTYIAGSDLMNPIYNGQQ